MSELIEIYSTNIENNITMINSKIAECDLCSSSQYEAALKEIDALIKETDKIVKNYEIEITMNSIANNKLSEYRSVLSINKTKLNKLKLDLKKDTEEEESSKEKLINPNEELAYNSFNKLQRATRATIEMENMSNGILVDLDNQSGQMKNVNVKLGDMTDQLSSSSNLLGEMLKNTNRNQLYIIAMGITLFVIFIVVLTVKIAMK